MTDAAYEDMVVAGFADAIAAAVDPAVVLREWSSRYPGLQADFAAVAVERAAEVGPQSDGHAADARALMHTLFAALSPINAAAREDADSSLPTVLAPTNLSAACSAAHIAFPDEIARRLRLSAGILERLNAGQFALSSLPVVLIDRIALTLNAARDQVIAWLQAPIAPSAPELAVVRENRAGYAVQIDFVDAIANIADLSAEDRLFWTSVIKFSQSAQQD